MRSQNRMSGNTIRNNPAFTDEDGGPQDYQELAPVAEEVTPNEDQQPEADEPIEEVQETLSEEDSAADEPVEETKVLISGKEYSQTELDELVVKGSKVREYETKNPGFDIDKFMPDYTRKSQELARIQRGFVKPPASTPVDDEPLGLDDEQLKTFERAAKRLGFVKKDDLVQNTVEAQKDAFLDDHPEYRKENDPGDSKWNSILQGLSLYNWQQHPDRVQELLERCHADLSKGTVEANRSKEVARKVVTIKARNAATALGSGAGRTSNPPQQTVQTTKGPSLSAEQVKGLRESGWTDAQIRDLD